MNEHRLKNQMQPCQALAIKTLGNLKEEVNNGNSNFATKLILLFMFHERTNEFILFYDSLVKGFLGEGATDIRCIKYGQSTPDTYSIYPLSGVLNKRNPRKDIFRKIPWENKYPSAGSLFCVVRPRVGISKEFRSMFRNLSIHCRKNKIPEFLITPAWIGSKSRVSKYIKVIEWSDPDYDSNIY